MKTRIVDIILILLIVLLYVSMLGGSEFLGGNMGKIICGIFLASSLFISWKLAVEQKSIIKIFIYIWNFAILFSLSTIIIDSIIGMTSGTYLNIILLLILFSIYYFSILRKLLKSGALKLKAKI